MVTLRKFAQDDWDGFAGCEAENPLIGDINFIPDGGKELGGLIIVDKDDTQIYILDNNDVDISYLLKVPYITGKFIVERMDGEFDSDYLLNIGFKAIRLA